MHAKQFDQFVRSFAVPGTRRRLLTATGGLLALGRQQRAGATQVPDSCAATGDVCTLLYGCCSGLTCATSSINPSYGVCVPGEGGMVSTGTALVLPFDESDSSQTSTQTTTTTTSTSTTTTTDPQAERQARLETMRNRRRTNKDDQQARRQTQQDRAQEKREARNDRRGPVLSFDVFNPGAAGNKAEILQLHNSENTTIYVRRIESLLAPDDGTSLPVPQQVVAGDTLLFRSGAPLPTTENPDQSGELTWSQLPVCTEGDRGGFAVYASVFSSGTSTRYMIKCDGTEIGGGHRSSNKNGTNGDQRKRRKNNKSRNKGNGKGR